jgi:hypothetical protein
VIVLFISAPVSIVVTLFLLPLWSWLEASSGIESIGHSGPVEWCYVVVFILLVVGALLALWTRQRRQRTGAGGN